LAGLDQILEKAPSKTAARNRALLLDQLRDCWAVCFIFFGRFLAIIRTSFPYGHCEGGRSNERHGGSFIATLAGLVILFAVDFQSIGFIANFSSEKLSKDGRRETSPGRRQHELEALSRYRRSKFIEANDAFRHYGWDMDREESSEGENGKRKQRADKKTGQGRGERLRKNGTVEEGC